jgi:hypothetical protein
VQVLEALLGSPPVPPSPSMKPRLLLSDGFGTVLWFQCSTPSNIIEKNTTHISVDIFQKTTILNSPTLDKLKSTDNLKPEHITGFP